MAERFAVAGMSGLVALGNMGPDNITKFDVVALPETLFEDLRNAGSEVGVSVLCPAFVRTQILTSERNRPAELKNEGSPATVDSARGGEMRAAIEAGLDPAVVASAVYDAVLEKKL